ncbi:chymotrypsin-1 [Stomoxys calcitrans]|uniref:Peptidase S1 domain-containing protein n=1 Tax=Stomoxys calcitrans TaxID=35570 RepID=A0A1I8PLW9_STOCA|nr:chymotrypsin-1 [Stomoxys calcitrans]
MVFRKVVRIQLFLVLLCLIHHQATEARAPKDSRPPLRGRIVGGSNAREGQFAYQVSLRLDGSHLCGGSVISADYILTAAHCVYAGGDSVVAPSVLSIMAGSNRRNSGGQQRDVSEIKVHPNYTGSGNDSDIALLKLSSPLELNDDVQTIALATEEPPLAALVTASGWGRLSEGGARPDILQYINMIALPNSECRTWTRVSNNVICLLHLDGQGACNGDSGGPAVYNNELVGVANAVFGECGTFGPDVYSSVAFHRDWVLRNSQD